MGERYDRVRELAKKNGTTVAALERELGFAKGSLSKMDRNAPSSERIQKLANRLNTTVGYIMDGNDDYIYITKDFSEEQKFLEHYFKEEAHDAAVRSASDRTLRLLYEAIHDSSAEQINQVYDYLLFLKEKENKGE